MNFEITIGQTRTNSWVRDLMVAKLALPPLQDLVWQPVLKKKVCIS
jgi:hypothetical protein